MLLLSAGIYPLRISLQTIHFPVFHMKRLGVSLSRFLPFFLSSLSNKLRRQQFPWYLIPPATLIAFPPISTSLKSEYNVYVINLFHIRIFCQHLLFKRFEIYSVILTILVVLREFKIIKFIQKWWTFCAHRISCFIGAKSRHVGHKNRTALSGKLRNCDLDRMIAFIASRTMFETALFAHPWLSKVAFIHIVRITF